jgi:hypothetical protein
MAGLFYLLKQLKWAINLGEHSARGKDRTECSNQTLGKERTSDGFAEHT